MLLSLQVLVVLYYPITIINKPRTTIPKRFYHQPTKVRAKKLNKNKIAKVDKKIVAIDFPVCLNCIYDKKNKPKDVIRKYIAGISPSIADITS